MKYTAALNNKTLKMNTGDLLKKIDFDGSGNYTKDELKKGMKASASIFAKPFINDKLIGDIYSTLDTNNDGKVTENELENYLQQNYGMKLEDAKKMNVKDFVNYIQDYNSKKRK